MMPASPLGDATSVSGRVLRPFSDAGRDAAINLLDKVRRALAARDSERAQHFALRAARLPFDRHEGVQPACAEAEYALFDLVTDVMESQDDDDETWLDAAVAAMTIADDTGRRAMRDALVDIDTDYGLSRTEQRALRAAIAQVPAAPPIPAESLEPEVLAQVLLSILTVETAYLAALADRAVD
jgi:hypothetical protein